MPLAAQGSTTLLMQGNFQYHWICQRRHARVCCHHQTFLVQIKQLLVLVTPVNPPATSQQSGPSGQGHQAMVKGSCLMDMLMTVQALQYPLLDLLLDVMLMCCQHLIMLEGQSWDLNDTEEDDQLEADSVSDSGQEAEAGQSRDRPAGKAQAGAVAHAVSCS